MSSRPMSTRRSSAATMPPTPCATWSPPPSPAVMSGNSAGSNPMPFGEHTRPGRHWPRVGTMNRTEFPSLALRAPSPIEWERDGVRACDSWVALVRGYPPPSPVDQWDFQQNFIFRSSPVMLGHLGSRRRAEWGKCVAYAPRLDNFRFMFQCQPLKNQAMKQCDFLKVTGGAVVGRLAFVGLFDDWVIAGEAKTTDIRDIFQNY